MSSKGFFWSGTQKQSIFWEFFLDVNLKNTSIVNLLDAFYKYLIELLFI